MALLWIEGFEGFGSSIGDAPSPGGIVERKYARVANEYLMDIEAGRSGDYCLEMNNDTVYIQTPHLTTDDTLVCGVAFKCSGLPTALRDFLFFYENTQVGMQLRLNTDGRIAVYNNNSLLGTTTNQLLAATWYYLEFKVLTHDSAGEFELRINNTEWLSASGVDTQPGSNAYHTAVRFSAFYTKRVYWDDVYILDSTGSANNDFLGNRSVVALDPSGAGDSTGWTPSAGSNYENVDDGGLTDEDTTYNEASSDVDDLYGYGNLPAGASSVDGIQITTEVKVTAGTVDLSNLIKSDTTTSAGSPETITSTSYVTTTRVEEEDPHTSAAWVPADLDAAQFGIRADTP